MSQALAQSENRSLVESRLWQRLVQALKEADVPLDDEAPDFVVAASASPPVGVFRLATAPDGEDEEEDDGRTGDGGNPFEYVDDEEGE